MFDSAPAPRKFVHSSTSLGCTLLSSHDTTASLSVNKKATEDNRTSADISVFFFVFPLVLQIWRTDRRRKRFRNASDAMCHRENKQG